MDKLKLKLTSNHILWAIYLALLATLLPHTAWVFAQFESTDPGAFGWQWGKGIAWTAAFAFEAAIAAFTRELARHNEKTPRYQRNAIPRKFAYRYLNPFALALITALSYSALTNFTHAVEFGRPLKVFQAYSLSPKLYAFTFGGILPLCSLIFALALSTSSDTEANRDEELAEAKAAEHTANREKVQLRKDLVEAKLDFAAAKHEFTNLTANRIKDRIEFAHQRWPELSNSEIAAKTGASPAYVSEVINQNGTGEE